MQPGPCSDLSRLKTWYTPLISVASFTAHLTGKKSWQFKNLGPKLWNTIALIFNPACCTKAGALFLQFVSKSWTRLKHKTSQPNKLAKCPPTTRAPLTVKSKPSSRFSSTTFSRAFVAQVRSPLHDHGAINSAQENPTTNSQPSPFFVKMRVCLPLLWCRYCADGTDLFDNDFNFRNSWKQQLAAQDATKVSHTNHGSQEVPKQCLLEKQTNNRS